MPPRLALALAFLLAISVATPVRAGISEICKQNLAVASASMEATRARLKTARAGDESCVAYRRHFLELVKARAVTAQCKNGSEREQDLGKLDGAVEDINGMIAARCGS
jgi:hypothetical protein